MKRNILTAVAIVLSLAFSFASAQTTVNSSDTPVMSAGAEVKSTGNCAACSEPSSFGIQIAQASAPRVAVTVVGGTAKLGGNVTSQSGPVLSGGKPVEFTGTGDAGLIATTPSTGK